MARLTRRGRSLRSGLCREGFHLDCGGFRASVYRASRRVHCLCRCACHTSQPEKFTLA